MTTPLTTPTVTAFGGTQHRVVLPEIGEQIDRYAILAELGSGAMGAVFLAADTQLDRRIAVKVLTRATQDSRLLDEARALAKLQHPNVVAIHDVGRWNERVYLAMEYIEGGSLASWLDTHADWRERLATFVQAAHGLAAAHRAGLVHHDVKPSNIMVGKDGRVRLVDFGLARATPDLADGTPAGTPRYMSPEQRRGALADARTDQFSLCVALYEALFDDHPFAGASAEERGAAVFEDRVEIPKSTRVPAHVVVAIIKGLACEPDRRHSSIDALIGALSSPPKSRRIAWIAAAGSMALAAGITTAIVTSSAPSDDRVVVPADARKAILAASNLPDELLEPLPGDPYGVTVHRLSNGLTVYISPNHDVPRIRTMWRFNGGNADAPGIAAAAGLVATEHGTETVGTINYAAEKPHLDRIRELYRERAATTGEARARIDGLIDLHSTLASLVEIPDEHERILHGLGASHQSHTVFPHEMKFTTELPSNRLGAWADVEADVWTHRVIRNFRGRLRRLNVETQDAVASVDLRAFDGLLATWFPGEHHEASTHDIVAGMATEPLDAVEAYARDHFVPNNADLVLVGDVDPTTAIPLLEKAFAAWEPRELPALAPRVRPTPIAKTIDIPSSGQRTINHLWPLDLTFDDNPVLYVIDELLGRLATSRFASRPGEFRTGSFVRMRDFGVMELPTPGMDFAEAERTIDMVVGAVRHGEFSDDDLEAVKRNLRFAQLYIATDLDLRLESITKFHMREISWQTRVAGIVRLPSITRADVQRVADRMFSKPYVTERVSPGPIHVDRVDVGPEPRTMFPKRHTSPAGEALIARPHTPLQPKFLLAGRDYEGKQLRGTYLVAARLSGSLSQLDVRWEVGDQELPVLCTAITARRDSPAILELMFRYALRYEPRCSMTGIELKIDGSDDQLAHALELASAVIADPTPDEWTRAKAQVAHVTADHRGEKDWFGKAADLFGRHGFAVPNLRLWSAKVNDASTYADALHALHGLRASDRAIAYAGPRSIDDVAPLVPAKGLGPAPKPLPITPLVKMPRVLMLDGKGFGTAVEASVQLMFDGTERRALLDLLQQYWLPAVHPMRISGQALVSFDVPSQKRDPRTIVNLKIDTTAADAAAAVEGAIAELTTSHADPAIVAAAKAEIDERMRADWLTMDDLGGSLLEWHALGIEGDPREAQFVTRERLTAADLDRFAAAMRRAPRLVTVWGDLTGVDRARLRRLGTPVELGYNELIRRIDQLAAKRCRGCQ